MFFAGWSHDLSWYLIGSENSMLHPACFSGTLLIPLPPPCLFIFWVCDLFPGFVSFIPHILCSCGANTLTTTLHCFKFLHLFTENTSTPSSLTFHRFPGKLKKIPLLRYLPGRGRREAQKPYGTLRPDGHRHKMNKNLDLELQGASCGLST